jgi:protein-S-isoprenylcysteine O-methyltransferase Ste14
MSDGWRAGSPVLILWVTISDLWYTLLGFKGNPHLNPIHIASNPIIAAGFFLLSAAWRVLYDAQRDGSLATAGPYAYVRHPQYVGFIAIMFGFLLQWPTLITLTMFPVMVTVYVKLAHREEAEVRAEIGPGGMNMRRGYPDFIPRLSHPHGKLPGSPHSAHT